MSTSRERMENRLGRRLDWADSRKAEATRRFGAADQIASAIPFGQPILVGHHSERHHRRDLGRIDANMRAGIESSKMADRHESVAANLERRLENTIFSDDDNAIEALRTKIAGLEAKRDRIKALNKAIRREMKGGLVDGWLDRIGATEAEKSAIMENVKFGGRHEPMFPGYVTTNIGGRIKQAQDRIKDVEARNARHEQAEAAGGVAITINDPYAVVVFAEKPDREIIDALKAAGFRWGGGSWGGRAENIPVEVLALTAA